MGFVLVTGNDQCFDNIVASMENDSNKLINPLNPEIAGRGFRPVCEWRITVVLNLLNL